MKLLSTVRARMILIGLLLLPAIVYAFTTSGLNRPSRIVVDDETLPAKIGDWTGEPRKLTDTELSILHSPSASQKIYTSTSGDQVQVLIIQVENTQNAHDPRLCMAGSGYSESKTFTEPAPWADSHPRNEVSHSIFSKDGDDLHMYYWMSTTSGTIANMSTGLKLEGMIRALKGEPTRGLAVRVLGWPNHRTGEPVHEEVLQDLWQQVREEIDFDRLVREQ